MNTEPPNLVLELLRDIRAKQNEQSQQIGALAQGQVSIRAELRSVNEAVSGIQQELRTVRDSLHEVAIAIDGHSQRLDRIEHHLGLDANKH